jgi:hypothetical protein
MAVWVEPITSILIIEKKKNTQETSMKSGTSRPKFLKMEAKYSSETSVHMNGLHGGISQKMGSFNITNIVNVSVATVSVQGYAVGCTAAPGFDLPLSALRVCGSAPDDLWQVKGKSLPLRVILDLQRGYSTFCHFSLRLRNLVSSVGMATGHTAGVRFPTRV